MTKPFTGLPEGVQDEMFADVFRVADAVLDGMRVTSMINDLPPYVVLCGYLNAAALYAGMNLREDAAADFPARMGVYLQDAVERARIMLAEKQAQGATTQ